jgi:bifunctional non-homologous end joining protein LigD
VNFYSRNQIFLNERYPEIAAALRRQDADSFIVDSEIVTFKGRLTSFAKLQERMQVAHPSPELMRRIPVWFYLFDLIYLGSYDTRHVPLRWRKELLRRTLDFQDPCG